MSDTVCYNESCSKLFHAVFVERLKQIRPNYLLTHYPALVCNKNSGVWSNGQVFQMACAQAIIPYGLLEIDRNGTKAVLDMVARNCLNDMFALDQIIIQALDTVIAEESYMPIEDLEKIG